jgi:DNA primase
MSLRKKIPTDQVRNGRVKKEEFKADADELISELAAVKGKLSARLFDDDRKLITEIEIKDLINTLSRVQPAHVVLDGIITQRLVDTAHKSSVKTLVGVNTAADIKDTYGINILTERETAPS